MGEVILHFMQGDTRLLIRIRLRHSLIFLKCCQSFTYLELSMHIFLPQFSVADDESALKLWYAVGDYPGGTNIVDWTEMSGTSLLAPAELPCGVPLYFLAKARNSQGLESTAQCSLPTYDCTFPEGRVDAAFR